MARNPTCPHGIQCDYIYRTTIIQGERYVTGGDYWHTPDQRCTVKQGV